MKKEKILKLAIEKAIKNGWDYRFEGKSFKNNYFEVEDYGITSNGADFSVFDIIFSHEFAKAFFKGISPVKNNDYEWELQSKRNVLKNKYGVEYDWQYYLRQLVLCKEPLKYLEKFL